MYKTNYFSGAYAQLVTSKNGVNIKYIESDSDRIMYEYTVPPRFWVNVDWHFVVAFISADLYNDYPVDIFQSCSSINYGP